MAGPEVTLEDVLAAVRTKRVPLAAELAGYLALEVADALTTTNGEPNLSATQLSEDGVLSVQTAPGPDAESAVRALLAHLLEAGGQQTPALAQAAKRNAGAGMKALVVELEAALIPVNRAAGRRAMARLAREVNRTSGDSVRPSHLPGAKPLAPPLRAPPRKVSGGIPRVVPPPLAGPSPSKTISSSSQRAAPRSTATPPPSAAAPPSSPGSGGASKLPPPPARAMVRPTTKLGLGEHLFGGDEVDSLLSTFEVTNTVESNSVATELKAIAGIDGTPPPPGVRMAEMDADGGAVTAPPPALGAVTAPPHAGESALPGPASHRPPPPAARVASVAPRRGGEGGFRIGESARAPLPSGESLTGIDGVDGLLALDEDKPLDELDDLIQRGERLRGESEPPSLTPALEPLDMAEFDDGREHSVDALTLDASIPPAAAKVTALLPGARAASPPALPAPAAPWPPPGAAAVATGARAAATGASPAFGQAPPSSVRQLVDGPRPRERRAPKTALALSMVALVALVAGSVAVWKLAPGFFTGRTPDRVAKEREEFDRKKAEADAARAKAECKAAIVISDVPDGAEVLLRVGQAPADVERMPMKRRLEFVLTADGYAPKRVVVLPTADWEKKEGGKLVHELPVELATSATTDAGTRAVTSDPWPPSEPGTEVGGAGDPGTVHISARPRGAEVWFLIGVSPEARIDRLRCDADVEALVARGGERKRLKVTKEDLAKALPDDKGMRSITISAK